MTKEEFEAGYARRSGVSVQRLKALGLVAVPCGCAEEGCNGWQMAHTTAYMARGDGWQIDLAASDFDYIEISNGYLEYATVVSQAEFKAFMSEMRRIAAELGWTEDA